MASNYDDALSQLHARGLVVDGLIPDGRTHRCRVDGEDRERRGWYLLHEFAGAGGQLYIVGSFGVWHGNNAGTQKITLHRDALSAEETAALKARLADDRKRAKAHRDAQAKRAATRAGRVWAKASTAPPEGGCAYLVQKDVNAYGVRFTDSGALVIPMCDARGTVHGLQFILPVGHPHRAKTGRAKTYWPAGLAVTGHYHVIGNPAAVGVCLVVEGYATGATLHAATDLPVAVAFAANNLQAVGQAIVRATNAKILICGDDDYLTDGNPGQAAARAAALAVDGAWLVPAFPADRGGEKLTDFNDLQLFPSGGAHLVAAQVNAKLDALGWRVRVGVGRDREGGGESDGLKPLLTIDEACDRYSLVYGGKATLFDHWEHELIPKADVLDVLPDSGWRDWKIRPDRKLVRMREVGFDPAETDESIRCNLWAGWPTQPKRGKCDALLELLEYLCGTEADNKAAVRDWVLNWLAYPIQHAGAKMKTALVFHGPQGVGKNLFFEAVMAIYGDYGRIVDQSAVEDKFNDWASKKLFMVCDEVVARMELYHLKNKLKSLITGEWIRINPKNVSPHDERNHVNLVFLSNERQPLVLERDDRRYMVVYVPDKLPAEFYKRVGDEIASGGIGALHQFLLDRELGDFKPWSAPLPTRAKGDLIEVSLESSERFLRDWIDGDTEFPFGCCGSMQLYAAYRRWANANGVARPRESNHFLAAVNKTAGWAVGPRHIYATPDPYGPTRSQKMVVPAEDILQRAGRARPPNEKALAYYSAHFYEFDEVLNRDRY